jgi:DNA-binding NarL/FixJ family response regulator
MRGDCGYPVIGRQGRFFSKSRPTAPREADRPFVGPRPSAAQSTNNAYFQAFFQGAFGDLGRYSVPPGRTMPSVKIQCIEDDRLLRELLAIQLEVMQPKADIIKAADGRTGLQLARAETPDLVVLDLKLPDMPGLQVAMELSGLRPPPRVLILTATASEAVLNRVFYSPVHGFVLKSSGDAEELLLAVRKLLAGETYFSRTVLAAMTAARSHPDHFSKILSAREVDLLPLFGYGWLNERISQHTGLSVATVRTHHQHILGKLGLHSREELMRWAMIKGFVDFSYEPREPAAAAGR